MLLARVLGAVIKRGELIIIDATGRSYSCGDARRGPTVTIRVHDRGLHTSLALDPRLRLGEAYMDGRLTVEGGTIYDYLDLVGLNIGGGSLNRLDRWTMGANKLWRSFQQANRLGRAQKNVAHHYDLSGALYELFLDSDRQYSCGYFPLPGITLDEAQEAKKRHLASKLLLEPGQKVLDIGSGWGGLGLYLARTAGVEVTGLTLSSEQHKVSERRAAEAGLSDRVHFHLRDYRQESASYDRIVSVGMFEHVGRPYYEEFFRKVHDLLRDDGVALLHTIADHGVPSTTNPWLRKYIFPGGYTPSLSEVVPVIERVGLWITDIEILRLHYAETLRHWRERFMSNRYKAVELYDERFCRMWEFYLSGAEVTFRRMGQIVVQIQLTKSVDAVPLTRDYMANWEQEHTLAAEPAARRLKSVS